MASSPTSPGPSRKAASTASTATRASRSVTTSTRTTSARRFSNSTRRRDRPPCIISAAVARTASRSSRRSRAARNSLARLSARNTWKPVVSAITLPTSATCVACGPTIRAGRSLALWTTSSGSSPIAKPSWAPCLDGLDRLDSMLAAALDRWKVWVLAVFSISYFAITSVLAWYKLLWNDELFTLYIARLPTYADIWSFLASGVEQLPPTFHILSRLCMKLFGMNPWALRLPEILGVGVMSLCLFVVVSRRSSAAYGLIAMLLPLVTHVFYYATEARPYGLVLGCAALSLLCWQSAADDRRRVLSLVGLAVSLSAALASHYYAVFIFVPLAAGEIARTVVRRRLDPSMWLAFALATLPLWVFLPLIQTGRRLGATFWARPRWFDMVTFYPNLLGLTASGGIFLFIAILSLLTTYALVRSSIGAEPKHGATSRIPVPEVVAALWYLAIPALGVLLAKVATGAFTDRYALTAVLGLALIIPWGAYVILDGRATLGIALAAVLFSWFVAKDGIEPAMTQRRELGTLQDTLAFLKSAAPDEAPLVIASPHLFFQLSYYASPRLASRLVYLTDTAASMRYVKTDTVELGLQEFRRWIPMSVEDYRSYVRAHPRFLLYGDTGAWIWLLPELMTTGARLQLVAVKGSLRLFLVDTAPESSDRAGARPGKADPWPSR